MDVPFDMSFLMRNGVNLIRYLYHTYFFVRVFTHLLYSGLGFLSVYFSLEWHSWLPLVFWFLIGIPIAFIVLRSLPNRKFILPNSLERDKK
jgi:hypothetical protein